MFMKGLKREESRRLTEIRECGFSANYCLRTIALEVVSAEHIRCLRMEVGKSMRDEPVESER